MEKADGGGEVVSRTWTRAWNLAGGEEAQESLNLTLILISLKKCRQAFISRQSLDNLVQLQWQ